MRIVPSQVVTFINRAFPEFGGSDPTRLWLPAKSRPRVASALAMIESLRPEHLANLSPEQWYRWTIAVTLIRDAIELWSSYPASGNNLGGIEELDKRQPLLVVCDIVATCPDDAPTVSHATLAFLADPALQATLALDISTARSALANGEYKAASVMAGSVMEALLLWATTTRKMPAEVAAAAVVCRGRGVRIDGNAPEGWSLAALICVARELDLITDATRNALDGARDFRNLIHPGRAQRTGQRPTLGTATLAVGAMQRLVEELA